MTTQKRLLLEETKNGVITLTPFDPRDVLHEVYGLQGSIFRYTVQDLIDNIYPGPRWLDDSPRKGKHRKQSLRR
jgi:hypothetical protein